MSYTGGMFKVELEQETDDRWIAEAPELHVVITYGASREEAVTRAQADSDKPLKAQLDGLIGGKPAAGTLGGN